MDKFISTTECAKILQVNVRTIIRAIRSGKLKAFKVGQKMFRIKESDFKIYLNNLGYSVNQIQMKEKIKTAIETTKTI